MSWFVVASMVIEIKGAMPCCVQSQRTLRHPEGAEKNQIQKDLIVRQTCKLGALLLITARRLQTTLFVPKWNSNHSVAEDTLRDSALYT